MPRTTVVLVVDADDSLASVRRVCETAGFVTIHVHGVDTARPYVERYIPAVTIMSCTPSDRDSLAWIAELRRTLPDALIIVVGDKDDASVLDAGADVILERPIDEHVLAATLQPLLAVEHAAPASTRLRLVVVEPDERLAKVMQRWLGKVFEISIAANGSRALEELRHRRPDVVLAELRLPDMDATELYDAIEKLQPGLGERTLFMTTGFVADRAHQFLSRVPGQWIYKPFDLRRLRAAIDALFN